MDQIQLISKSAVIGIRDSTWGLIRLYYLIHHYFTKPQQKNSSSTSQSSKKKKNTQNEELSLLIQVLKCFILNGVVFWCSIELFNRLVVPGFQFGIEYTLDGGPTANLIWSWLYPCLSLVFRCIWEVPMFCISKVINCLWFQDIAESAFRQGGSRRSYISSFSKFIADFLFSVVVQTFFLVQAMLCKQLPMSPLGDFLYLIQMSFLYSLYAFEYKWYNMGWELHKRLAFIENNWPYFIGFGLILAILTSLDLNFFICGCIFSLLFPLLIVAANEAEPVVGACNFPIRFFSPVVWLANAIFQRTMTPTRPTSAQIRRNVPSIRVSRAQHS